MAWIGGKVRVRFTSGLSSTRGSPIRLILLEPGVFGFFETLEKVSRHGFEALGVGWICGEIFEFPGI